MSKITVSFTSPGYDTEDAARNRVNGLRSQAESVGLEDWTFESFTTPPPAATLTVAQLVALGVSQDAAEAAVRGDARRNS